MAKKQPVKIKEEPLSVTELGSVAEKKGNVMFLLLLFLILAVSFFCYPYVAPYIDDIIAGKNPFEPETVVETEEEAPTEKETTKTIKSLTCKKGSETLTYTNSNDGITQIIHTIELNSNSETFVDNYLTNEALLASYEGKDGYVTSNVSTGDIIIYTIKINLKKADLSISDSKYYFAYKTALEKVKSEMTRLEFKCSEA